VPPDPTSGAFLEDPADWAGVYHRVEPVGGVIPATTRSAERLATDWRRLQAPPGGS